MQYKIILKRRARLDLALIEVYISKDDKKAANKYIRELLDKISLLETFPMLGKKLSSLFLEEVDLYYLLALKHIVFYKVYEKEKTIKVIRILSQRQDYLNIIGDEI